MSVPKTLLLTGVSPGNFGVGGVYLRDLCMAFPHDRLCCVFMDAIADKHKSAELGWLPTEYVPAMPEWDWPDYDNRVARAIRGVKEVYREKTLLPLIIKKVVDFGRHHNVDLICVPLHSPTTIRVAVKVSEMLQVPLVSIVWDPPAFQMNFHKVDRFTMKRLISSFEEAVRKSVRCGVASYPLKRRYEGLYGTTCIPLMYGHDYDAPAKKNESDSKSQFVIGYAGNIYAKEEWASFTESLGARNWEIAGKKVVLRVLGQRMMQETSMPMNIEYLGYHSTRETLDLLSGMDAAYLPYWLDNRFSEAVQFCFPGKLSTYVAARLPVFFHGPPHSSVMEFFQKFPLGIGCHTLDSGIIINTFERFVRDSEFREKSRLASANAYQQELSNRVFLGRFAELIGIRDTELRVGS